jgi:hypothetical protein
MKPQPYKPTKSVVFIRPWLPRGQALLLLALGLAGLALAYSYCLRIDIELQSLAPTDRRQLYERTLQTLRGICPEVTGTELTDFCRDQAALLGRFPECDDGCRQAIHRVAPRPIK